MEVTPYHSFLLQSQQNCSSREYTVVSDHHIIMMIVLSSNLTFFFQIFSETEIERVECFAGQLCAIIARLFEQHIFNCLYEKKLRKDAKEKN